MLPCIVVVDQGAQGVWGMCPGVVWAGVVGRVCWQGQYRLSVVLNSAAGTACVWLR